VETNSLSNKVRHRRKKRTGQTRPNFFWYAQMARKTQQRLPSGRPSVVEMYVPLDEVDTVVEREPAVHVQMVLR
jgi:hypothetical protein